ncbi:Sec-independent protein translocase protein TatC [Frankliniella fusca]|uniref:Sec-independent protein translocase protein TatC n=1 Tax=Frankliniella fusca TaxID=407009 RepID=A0AAE1HG66_9NEOP|nr:Sec-independent protein translocase protein TatC [Frankliniella fusca]
MLTEDEDIDLVKSAGKMILNIRQTGAITGSAVERFQDECFKMVKDVAKVMKQKVKKFLVEENINTPQSRNLLRELCVDDPFQLLRTMKQQLKYFAEELGLVPPETKFLAYRTNYKLNPTTLQYEPTRVPMSYQYIPVIKTLTLIMSNEKMRNLIEAKTPSADGIIRSYLDGTRAQTHPLVSRHPKILRLQLYWDDIEVVNPLGSKTTIHKIAAFYFSIQNLPPVESSQLSSIFLLALAFSEDIKYAGGFEKILAPFFAELRRLESETGIMIDIGIGRPFCFRATLTVLCADTLAAHDIMGLLAPGARHFCRFCMVSRATFRANLNAVSVRKTRAMLDEHVRLVEESLNLSTEFGVRKNCVLHLSRGFDATQDVIFDIFHDLLEGCCHWVVSLALHSFINVGKYFTLRDFRGRVEAFNYGVIDIKNKPSVNFTNDSLKGHKLKQTGCQMWCLIRIFGFLVPEVPEDDDNLKLVNLLQSILLIVFAEAVRPEDIVRLEQLIQEHHSLFQRLHVTPGFDVFADDSDDEEGDDPDDPPHPQEALDRQLRRNLKINPGNKLHHMTHYPELLRSHGSLIRYWCARYEGRHQIFCKYGSVCCNFINIVKSMAQMYQISTLSGILKTTKREDMELQGSENITVEFARHRHHLIECGLRPEDKVCDVEAVCIGGETYRPGLFVIVDTTTPTFAIIQYVYVKDKHAYLILMPWRTVDFERRYCAYQVVHIPDTEPIILRHSELGRHGVIPPWNPCNQRSTYIAPRTILF